MCVSFVYHVRVLYKSKMPGMNKRAIRKVHPLLKIISSLGAEERRVLLHYLTHDACEGIYECIETLRKSLSPQKNKFRMLLKEHDPHKKQRALVQVGDGVGLILNKVVPLLGEYLGEK